jgi:hypothetical protein
MTATDGWRCGRCSEVHRDPPMAYGAAAPLPWFGIPEAERGRRAELTPDLCLIDGKHGYVVGNLELPVHGQRTPFSWDVWVSLSPENFRRTLAHWERPDRVTEPAYFGWVSTSLPGYPQTLNLKAKVVTRAVGVRPRIELEPTDHPLAVEQRRGITMARVREIAETILHG